MDKKLKRLLYATAFLLALPIIAYLINFCAHSFSGNPADWGTFGDFIGGTTNPIIALATLGVTIYIAMELTKLETKMNDKTIETTYKPELVIEERHFRIYTGKGVYERYPVEFSYERFGSGYLSDSITSNGKELNLKLLNIGLGATKRVAVRFEFDVTKAVSIISEMNAAIAPDDSIVLTANKQL